jgi:hypothetical protein
MSLFKIVWREILGAWRLYLMGYGKAGNVFAYSQCKSITYMGGAYMILIM